MEICCKNWHTLCLISTELGEKLWEQKLKEIFWEAICKECKLEKANKELKRSLKILRLVCNKLW